MHEPPRFPPSSLLHRRRLSATCSSSCQPPSLFVGGNLLRLVPAARVSPISPLENSRQDGHVHPMIDHHQRRQTPPQPPRFPPSWLRRPPPSGTCSGSCSLAILFSGNLLKLICSSRPTPTVRRLEVRPSDYRSPPALPDLPQPWPPRFPPLWLRRRLSATRLCTSVLLFQQRPAEPHPQVSSRLTVEELKARCRARGLRVGGTKAQLVERLSGPNTAPPHGRYVPAHRLTTVTAHKVRVSL